MSTLGNMGFGKFKGHMPRKKKKELKKHWGEDWRHIAWLETIDEPIGIGAFPIQSWKDVDTSKYAVKATIVDGDIMLHDFGERGKIPLYITDGYKQSHRGLLGLDFNDGEYKIVEK